uniref:uncharacterized protein LOC122609526 n=1 Tax=Erigeron canadensis TaxID=72917 RepID=UPI001CB94453|nr:uncharacterized protein LOC122609526 [Erigeron canadensis]
MDLPSPNPNSQDIMYWKDRLGMLRDFSVNTAWEDLRFLADVVEWYNLVWFDQCKPKHAFILWLVIKRKLKTQDLLSHWDGQGGGNVSLNCSLCETQPDSHDHLFFNCNYSSQDAIIHGLMSGAKKKFGRAVICKLVLAATMYHIWQERNFEAISKKEEIHGPACGTYFWYGLS